MEDVECARGIHLFMLSDDVCLFCPACAGVEVTMRKKKGLSPARLELTVKYKNPVRRKGQVTVETHTGEDPELSVGMEVVMFTLSPAGCRVWSVLG